MTIKRVVDVLGVKEEREFSDENAYQNYLRLKDGESHVGFFQHVMEDGSRQMREEKPYLARQGDDGSLREDRQTLRRLEAFQELAQVITRVAPGTGINAEYVSFEKWRELDRDYMQAIESGESHASAFIRVGYQPLPIYLKKIQPEGKKPVRPVFQHEVGVRPTGAILILKDQYPGDLGTTVVGPHTFKEKK